MPPSSYLPPKNSKQKATNSNSPAPYPLLDPRIWSTFQYRTVDGRKFYRVAGTGLFRSTRRGSDGVSGKSAAGGEYSHVGREGRGDWTWRICYWSKEEGQLRRRWRDRFGAMTKRWWSIGRGLKEARLGLYFPCVHGHRRLDPVDCVRCVWECW